MDHYHYTRLVLEEEREYADVLTTAAIRLGLGRRVVRVADLARRTAWLVGCRECSPDGRGTDARAVASAAIYWVMLVDWARGLLPRPSPEQAWRLTGSSRPSFYRAIAVWSRYVLRLDHHTILRAGEAHVIRSRARTTVHRPGAALVAVTADGYVPLASGYDTVRLGVEADVVVLPVQGVRRGLSVAGYLKARVTLDLQRLLARLRERFGSDPFTTNDAADLLALAPSSMAQLLSRLRELGYVERLADSLWRLRETASPETRNGG